ncbi:hypothetical protein [Aurantimonas marina]|uniref:hypothetical protein n=1 Tax=Aurantimonas marina TaxID=2780508 RepID=UPI0019D2B153|nr:hypothetical protein [Aurantimonas marina]
MRKAGSIALAAAAVVFAVFVANIVIGTSGGRVFLSDVGEMLTLFLASVLFVVAVLQREQAHVAGVNAHTYNNGREEAPNVHNP